MYKWRVILAVAALLAGCVDSGPNGDRPPDWELREQARLGAVDGGGGALTALAAILPQDSIILVLESSPARLTSFARSGRWLRDMARQGAGPGELRRPSLLGRTGDDLWVGDPVGGRLEVFTLEGNHRRSYRWDIGPDSLGVSAFPAALLDDGSILAGPGSLPISRVVTGGITHRSYYRVAPDGAVLAEIYREAVVPDDFFSAELTGGQAILGAHPIRESPLVAVFPDGSGLAVVERPEPEGPAESAFRFMVIRSNGDVETDRLVAYRAVSAEGWLEREVTRIEQDMMARAGAVSHDLIAAMRDGWVERRYFPPVSQVVAGSDGTVWVRREESAADSVLWQVFDRSGGELGQLRTPVELTAHWASRSELWGTLTNEYDVPFAVGFDVASSRSP